jgi:CHAD domain-containing protein
MRRLRSSFSVFKPVITDPRHEELREEVRWFTNQLGDARNLDVLLNRFGSGAGKDPVGGALVKRLRTERESAYARVLDALRSQRLRTLMLELVAWIESGDWRRHNEMAMLSLPRFAAMQLDKRWNKVRKGGKALAQIDPERRHQLRIEVKKLRYAVEFFASLPKNGDDEHRQRAFLESLETMQESLGELNDVETARDLLAKLLGSGAGAAETMHYAQRQLETSSAAGQLDEAQKAHGELLEIGRFWRN